MVKGADSVIDFVNAPQTVKVGIGIFTKKRKLSTCWTFWRFLRIISCNNSTLKSIIIQGAYTGNYADMVELLDLARKGVINPYHIKKICS